MVNTKTRRYQMKPAHSSTELEAELFSDSLVIGEAGPRGGRSSVAIPRDELPMLILWLQNQIKD